MKVRDNQNFLSLYYEPHVVETAVGTEDPHRDAGFWKREKKFLGQVATPPTVAELMARWVMSGKPSTVLDPAAGLGGLLHECYRLDPHVKLVGVERDRETLLQAKESAPSGTKLVLADYLLSDTGQFQGVIANPPYVKAHRLNYSEDTWRGFEERFGTSLDRLTNLYALFLLKIWEDLAPHARAAVLVPAEFLNANFGEEIKERLLRALRPAGLVVFNPSLNLFADALTTSAILFLEKGRPICTPILITKADSLEGGKSFLGYLLSVHKSGPNSAYTEMDRLNPRDKWLNILFNGTITTDTSYLSHIVGDYFDCRRGIATGGNDFFCLSKMGLCEHGLGLIHVVPCITKATDATGLVFSSEKFLALASSGRRCYLLNPSENGPALRSYLQAGERQGISRRHLPSHRPVWYLPENRAVADIWVAVFSRKLVKFILNTSGAKNLTCFHGLYEKSALTHFAPLMTLYLNSSWGAYAFKQVNRFYGDGLNKLEPKDVEALPCPRMPNFTQREAKSAIERLIELESVPLPERSRKIDAAAAEYFNLPPCKLPK